VRNLTALLDCGGPVSISGQSLVVPVTDTVVLAQIFPRVRQTSHVSNIPPTDHAHTLIHHQRNLILVTDTVVK